MAALLYADKGLLLGLQGREGVHAVGCEYVQTLVVVRKSRPKHVLILDSQWPDQLSGQISLATSATGMVMKMMLDGSFSHWRICRICNHKVTNDFGLLLTPTANALVV